MLKLFYKSFLVSILCGSLMLMDFSSKGIMLNTALAESVKTEKIEDKDLMGTLTMTVAGTIASRLYKYKMTTDIMLAAAGGALFLAGEVLAFLKLKEVMKGMEVQITRDKKGNINKEQIEALERLKKSYEEAKKTAETKKMLQMAAAAAFAAAGVMAYTMATVETTNFAACQTGIATALSTAAAANSSCAALTYGAAACIALVQTCVVGLQAYSSAFMADELAHQAIGPTMSTFPAFTSTSATATAALTATTGACSPSFAAAAPAPLITACTPKHTIEKLQSSTGTMLASMNNRPIPLLKGIFDNETKKEMIAQLSIPNSKTEQYFTKAFNLIFPPAQAELFSAMGIASSAAISYILMTSATIGPQIDMFLLIPQKRAIAWGILAGLTFMATSATENVISQIEANISKIDQILKGMYSMANGAVATQSINRNNTQTAPKPSSQLKFSDTDYGEVDINKGSGEPLPCYTGSNPKNCKSFTETVAKDSSFQGLNLESQKQLNGILSAANGVNGTSRITSGTLKSAASLAGSANALRVALDNARKKNTEALKNAKSKFNNDEQSKRLSGLLDKSMRDGLKKVNSNPSSMLATMYGGKGALAPSTAPSETEKGKLDPGNLNAPAANVVDMSAPGGSANDLGITGVEDGSKGEMTPEELAKLNEQNAALVGKGTIDEYDLKNDINNDSTTSLFDLISNRYQKSGYPRLFKIKEPQEPAPVTK